MSTQRDCQFLCEACGESRAVKCGVVIRHACPVSRPAEPVAPPPRPPGRLVRFVYALIRHAVNLFRWRTPWEIAELHTICKACPFYQPSPEPTPPAWWQRLLRITPTEGWCQKCGCGCGSIAAWLNKLAWRSEKCPEGKWHATTLWGSLWRWLVARGWWLVKTFGSNPAEEPPDE